jgi:hypothetical protein
MKRMAFLLFTSFACFGGLAAQGLGQFFSQHPTELNYYEQQIACLELFIGYLEKGYKIAQQGLTAISEIKKGELDLHRAFYSSLSSVNPQVGTYARIADIISLQISIINHFKKALLRTGQFSSSEISYLQKVYSNLSGECGKDLAELIDILTDGTMTMRDDERINRIDNLYGDMKDKYEFTQFFTSQASLLAAERADEQYEINFLNGL